MSNEDKIVERTLNWKSLIIWMTNSIILLVCVQECAVENSPFSSASCFVYFLFLFHFRFCYPQSTTICLGFFCSSLSKKENEEKAAFSIDGDVPLDISIFLFHVNTFIWKYFCTHTNKDAGAILLLRIVFMVLFFILFYFTFVVALNTKCINGEICSMFIHNIHAYRQYIAKLK